MLKFLTKLLVLPPGLLGVHARAYADLADQAWQQHMRILKSRWLMYGLAAACVLLSMVFGGTALLLWTALPVLDAEHAWVLWALPLFMLMCGAVFGLWAKRPRSCPLVDSLKEQIRLDVMAIRAANSS